MSQYLGRVKISANGEILDSRPGATLMLGGVTRTSVVNDQDMGLPEALAPARIECEVSLRRGASLDGMRNLNAATCVFECDTGQRYIVKDAFLTEPPQITGGEGGRARLIFEGKPAEEVVS